MADCFDFDTCPDRRGTDSSKWDGPSGVLPMFVADMDFRSPDCAVRAMQERAAHGVFGYTFPGESYLTAFRDWEKNVHSVTLSKEEIFTVSGVITGLSWAIHALCREGEGCIVTIPAYPPFFVAPKSWGVTVRECFLRETDGRWELDFDAFEALTREPSVTGFILCNPHNPTGRAWTRDELIRMLEICNQNGVWVFADEIHGDIIMPGTVFTSVLSLPDRLLERTVVLNAPSKTFNLPGLQTSNLIVRDPSLRKQIQEELDLHHVSPPNLMGLCAGAAVYREGKPWRDAMITYVSQNFRRMEEFFAQELPSVPFRMPEATYLAWLDFRKTGLTSRELDARFREAGVALGLGTIFGETAGEGFMRLTAACPRSMLEDGLSRIAAALKHC